MRAWPHLYRNFTSYIRRRTITPEQVFIARDGIGCSTGIAPQSLTYEFGARPVLFLPDFFELCRHFRRDGDRERNGGACHMSQSLASSRLGEEVKTCQSGNNVNI